MGAVVNRFFLSAFWIFGWIEAAPVRSQDRIGPVEIVTTRGDWVTWSFQFERKRGLKIEGVDWMGPETLVSIGYGHSSCKPPGGMEIGLSNGDLLRGSLAADMGESLEADTELGRVSLRLEDVAFVARRPVGRVPDLSRGDVLSLVDGDRDIGRLKAIGRDGVKFHSDLTGTEQKFPIDRVSAVYLQPLGRYRPMSSPAYVEVALAGGGTVKGELLEMGPKGGKLRCEVGSLGVRSFGRDGQVNFRNGTSLHLSDIDPVGTAERRMIPMAEPIRYRKDRAAAPGVPPIALQGRRYPKGLGVHSWSELTYELRGEFRQFRAVAGLDDSAGGGGSVVFVVKADGKEVFRSGLIAGPQWAQELQASARPKEIRVPVGGVKRLSLIVEPGPDDDVLDRAVWADAKLIR